MTVVETFPDITKQREPLALYTHLRIGGVAENFVQPRTVQELAAVLKFCTTNRVPLRMLGGGFNLLVRDDPIPGVVMRLQGEAFSSIESNGRIVRAAGGAQLYDLIAYSVKKGLGGLETLVGIRGTVGGSVRCNVGDKTGEIGSAVKRVAVLTEAGIEQIRNRDELTFSDHASDLDEPVILWVEFELEQQPPETLLKRMTKMWVQRKAKEPLSFQSYVRMFRDPAGMIASQLIDRVGLAKRKVGGAEVSDRNGNYAVAHPGTTARDILSLLDVVRDEVRAKTGISLDPEIHVW